jgi:hypothetical protein
MGPDLFDQVVPPDITIYLRSPEPKWADEQRELTVRLQPPGGRSIHFRTNVPRYSPENEVFDALARFFSELIVAQTAIPVADMKAMLTRCISDHVSPF